MAFKKQVTDNRGFSAEYWKIHSQNFDYENSICNGTMLLFKDEAARDADLSPVARHSGQIQMREGSIAREILYPLLKTASINGVPNFFSDAADV